MTTAVTQLNVRNRISASLIGVVLPEPTGADAVSTAEADEGFEDATAVADAEDRREEDREVVTDAEAEWKTEDELDPVG